VLTNFEGDGMAPTQVSPLVTQCEPHAFHSAPPFFSITRALAFRLPGAFNNYNNNQGCVWQKEKFYFIFFFHKLMAKWYWAWRFCE